MDTLNDMLGKITEFLKSEVKTETVIGQQFQLGSFTCVPVIGFGLGFGGGGGEGKGNAAGKGEGEGRGSSAGGGMGMGPVGFLVTKGDEIQFISTKPSKGLSSVFEKVPDLVEKYFDSQKKEKASMAS
jgi:uncharacterized spore protein YtfJ